MRESNDSDLLRKIDSSEDGASALNLSLREMPDGETTSTTSVEVNLEAFANISIALHTLNNTIIGAIDNGLHEHLRDYVRTNVSHRAISCMCVDFLCLNTAATDIVGVRQIDKGSGGWRRGFSPIMTGCRCLQRDQAIETAVLAYYWTVTFIVNLLMHDLSPLQYQSRPAVWSFSLLLHVLLAIPSAS
jgi:hypothetical protein